MSFTDFNNTCKVYEMKELYFLMKRDHKLLLCLRLSQATDINLMCHVLHVTGLDLEEGSSL
jgi:hypothetical protein